ncbi:ribonuclease E activity regulator RraA [Cupriavidus pinatubonensis]|uniref:4-hydroxy-4-methyl-2-oxoglutarate aldolase n=1 Tax=Cupriavidus pinatubonensis TaxID=248026 RepID=A0ABN7ZAT8_9BURK|nr:ribonuclease E activity regulator RraA [Cupriavidus pinatubonensis]CAG9183065.1 Putative 4-hydroxy-4-methyl-2-oxoglutarate aldolase [Cupriavidus pinatubonensis]
MTHTSTAFTSDLADRFSDRVQGFGSPFTHYGGRRAFHGVVETVRCPADAGLIRSCLAEPGRGRVLVVDAGGSTRVAVLGDKMAALGLGNGWAGVLVNGAIRDCEALSRIDFGVLALGGVPIRGGLQGAGERGVELDFAGIAFRRGGYVYADADGVLISDVALM